jgi:hypothetical protein
MYKASIALFLVGIFLCTLSSCRAKKVDCPAYGKVNQLETTGQKNS